MKDSELIDPKKTKKTLRQTEKKQTPQPTNRHHTDNITQRKKRGCPCQATPATPKPWQATACKRGTHNPDSAQEPHSSPLVVCFFFPFCFFVQFSPRRQPASAPQREIAQGTKVPHDGPAQVLIRLDTGRHKGVTRMQMARMRSVLAPVTQRHRAAAAPLVWEAAAT
jgi:hypothetical protein